METMMWIEEFEKQCIYIYMYACIRKALILSAESIQPSGLYLGHSNTSGRPRQQRRGPVSHQVIGLLH